MKEYFSLRNIRLISFVCINIASLVIIVATITVQREVHPMNVVCLSMLSLSMFLLIKGWKNCV